MTNFEVWKRGLVFDDLLVSSLHNHYRILPFTCSACPVSTCARKDQNFTGHDAICESSFFDWENAEAPQAAPVTNFDKVTASVEALAACLAGFQNFLIEEQRGEAARKYKEWLESEADGE